MELYNYLYASEPQFTQFNIHHIISLLSLLPAFIAIYVLNRLNLSNTIYKRIGTCIGLLVFINYPLWCILEIFAGSFDIEKHLPFHLCRISNLLILYVMIYKNRLLYNILFFWGMGAVSQAMFSPDITQTYPHFHFIRYFIGHHLFVVSIIYATVIYDMRISKHGILMTIWASILVLFLAFVANVAIGGEANYLWIMSKPPEGVKSILDYLGPHPIYILSGLVLSIIIYYIVFYTDMLIRIVLSKKISSKLENDIG